MTPGGVFKVSINLRPFEVKSGLKIHNIVELSLSSVKVGKRQNEVLSNHYLH